MAGARERRKKNGIVIGVDFGTDSVRAAAVRADGGEVIASSAAAYGAWSRGLYSDPAKSSFRQSPQELMEAFCRCVRETAERLGAEERACVAGIGVDTTGSTVAPVDRNGTVLSRLPGYAQDVNAMFCLWKDHTAQAEAREIDRSLRGAAKQDYCRFTGRYSAEWFWAKILHMVREEPGLRESAWSWTEHCDWMVAQLTGRTDPGSMYRSPCAAGFKALWRSGWGGLPDGEALASADPYLALVAERGYAAPRDPFQRAGTLTDAFADRLALPRGIAVSGSIFDAHAGAVALGVREGTLACSLGTSAACMTVVSPETMKGVDIGELTRFAGVAEGAILPGMPAVETGMAAYGDLIGWLGRCLLWPVREWERRTSGGEGAAVRAQVEEGLLSWLGEEAARADGADMPVSLDWINGRRYPDGDDAAKAVIAGLGLGTGAPDIYRSLVYAAAAGLKRICRGMERAGVPIERLHVTGGVAKRSPYAMQVLSNMLGREISVADTDQGCALGAAILAAAASGCADGAAQAQERMQARFSRRYVPDREKRGFCEEQYRRYERLCGTLSGGTF